MEIAILDDTRCHLGEGPVWDVAEQALYWVDILAPAVFRHDWAARTTQRWDLSAERIGSLAVRQAGGLILAMDTGLFSFDLASGNTRLIAEPLAGLEDTLFNDGKVDHAGRFVVGGVTGSGGPEQEPQPVCDMFRLETDLNVTRVAGDFVCFNGPCYSPDGHTFYVTGRGGMQYIEAFSHNPEDGSLCDGRVLIDDINPDGATVDSEGFIWSAQWGDGCVLRISPQGKIERRVELRDQVVSSVMFGGPKLDILFVTTLGRPHWNTIPGGPDAGAVFVIYNTGFRGLPEPRFKG